MEKIKSITFRGDWANIELEGDQHTGKKYSGNLKFNDKFKDLKVGDEIDCVIKDDKYINLAKDKKGGFPAKDYTFEKKRTALEQAVILATSGKVEMKDLIPSADKFFNWLK